MVPVKCQSRRFDVLVSDDDPVCRESVREALEPRGYGMHLASCGEEAVELARRHRVHVVIVDMNMPGMTGIETVRVIRRELSAEFPSILMSADDAAEMARQAMREHCDSFIPKPFDLSTLRRVVEEILRLHYGDD